MICLSHCKSASHRQLIIKITTQANCPKTLLTEKMERSIKGWHTATEPLPKSGSTAIDAAPVLERDTIQFNLNTIQLKRQNPDAVKIFFRGWLNHI